VAARENIFSRIRARQGKPAATVEGDRAAMRAHIAEHLQSARPRADWEPVPRFRERAIGLSSTVDQVESLAAVPAAVLHYLNSNALPLSAVCWAEFAGLAWHASGMEVAVRAARDSDQVGITGTFCAIAETGTLMTLSGPQSPATTSLLTETHIAIVSASRIVRGMEEAWRLVRTEYGKLPRAVNFISGPSRTADIEQTVTLGAHGPYRVHIIIVF